MDWESLIKALGPLVFILLLALREKRSREATERPEQEPFERPYEPIEPR